MARTLIKTHDPALRNYIINSAFDFWQRGTSFSNVSDSTYQADRWFNTKPGGDVVNVNRVDISALHMPAQYACRIDRSTNSGGFELNTNLETKVLREVKGKTITASVYIRKGSALSSDVTLTLRTTNTELKNGSNVDVATLVIPNANINTSTFTRFSVSLVVPSNTSALGLHFKVGASQAAGANVYFEITQAMINDGEVANPYTRACRTVAEELESCERYFEKSQNIEDGLGGASAGLVFEVSSASAEIDTCFTFKTRKRATPTVTIYSPSGINSGPTIQNAGENSFAVNGTTPAANGNFQFHWSGESEL